MSAFTRMGHALYAGEISINFVGRRLLWYSISGLIVVVAVLGLSTRGLNLGLEFVGGVQYTVVMPSGQATDANVVKIRDAVASTGVKAAEAPVVNTSGTNKIQIQIEPVNDNNQADRIANVIQHSVSGVRAQDISQDSIGATWGAQVANRALLGL
ncbi:MAG: protein translocase subunit SecF, partial [Nocardioidaceae bacterium]